MNKFLLPTSYFLLSVAFLLSTSGATPTLSRFDTFQKFSLFASASGAAEIPTYTNAQKLSLPSNTAPGTQVKVSDGFVVSGSGDPVVDGFHFPTGSTSGGKPTYTSIAQIANGYSVDSYGGGQWQIGGAIGAAAGNEDFPWLADWTGVASLTHPAVQQLAAANSAQGGVFVSGGTQDGIYTVRGTVNSRLGTTLLGTPSDYGGDLFSTVAWNIGNNINSWSINDASATELYYSLSDVATPDLASNWKNASDDSPASITVGSVTSGQIAAGIKFGSDFYTVTTPVNGRNAYHDVLGVAPDFTFNGTIWTDGTHNGTGAPAFPWDVTGISITQDDVASEANWEVVP